MNNPASRRRRKKVLKRAKGFVGGRSRLFRTANETVLRALAYAHRDRRVKKRTFRSLWIVRVNAACRMCGVSYSHFVRVMKKANIVINRKLLANIAVKDFETFKHICACVADK